MKKVIIDGVEYIPVTPEVKEEKRREIVVANKFNSVSSVCSDFKVTGITGAMRNLERAEFVEIKENEIILSEDDVKNAWLKAEYVGYPTAFFKALGFKKDGV